jgi:hypothetical protein
MAEVLSGHIDGGPHRAFAIFVGRRCGAEGPSDVVGRKL